MGTKYAALTFDDGPNTVTTPKVLEVLKKHGIKASFFLVGDNITEESAKVAAACFEYGCELCNHSRTHSAMPKQTSLEIREEIRYTDEKIKHITGGKDVLFFRPPYIAVCDSMYDDIEHTFICGVGAKRLGGQRIRRGAKQADNRADGKRQHYPASRYGGER